MGILKHFGEAEGYRLSRPFRKASVTLENQLLVGGVGDGEDTWNFCWRFGVGKDEDPMTAGNLRYSIVLVIV